MSYPIEPRIYGATHVRIYTILTFCIHIGMRSLTIMSWDHMEIMVPNSDLFAKPFTNWTRHDSVVRTVISIKIQRLDDPRKVQALIMHVLGEHKDVVTDHPPQVFLKEVNESLIEFEVRYFINIVESKSRPRVRSEVLFAIQERFTEYGIKPPYPHQKIHVQPPAPQLETQDSITP